MSKPYQIEAHRAVKQLEEMCSYGNPAVQMMLPMAEMVAGCIRVSGKTPPWWAATGRVEQSGAGF